MTRKRPSSKPAIRQERFASSAQLARPILANLVALRCQALSSQEDRELIWWIQEISLRDSFGSHYACTSFPAWPNEVGQGAQTAALHNLAGELCARFPERVRGEPSKAAGEMAATFPDLCLDPASDPRTFKTRRFDGLIDALRACKALHASAYHPRVADTKVASLVAQGLDFALSQRAPVLMEGGYRVGKSFAAQAWCLARTGRVRYVSLGAFSEDATTFFRVLAQSVGTAASAQRKAIEMRLRVEDALKGRDLAIVLDEAEFLIPSTARPQKGPERLDYLIKDLCNRGVPVVMIAGRNFARAVAHVEKHLPTWGSEQLWGRLADRVQLPDYLDEHDLFKVAEKLIPAADHPTRMLLVSSALASRGGVGQLEHAAKRAIYRAAQAGRAVQFEDAEAAIADASSPPSQPPSQPPRGPCATPPRTPRGPLAASRGFGASPILEPPGMFTGHRPPVAG